ncbi:serine protease [Agromyces sp. Soil535]|uniref:trypsin-like serine peptidase n=1 Tax=Agromyces sp. Soil535 TaxID=1736390 RepID=UPI0006FBE1C2|nr:serine protease [Agromyces sp. Soil535]KRE30970.1 hypothetical protein ASG80_00210 [Agromyces sp. Soil535]
MWTDDDLVEVIRSSPAVADQAVKAIQQGGDSAPADLDAFTVAAEVGGVDPALFCVRQLRSEGLVDAFAQALMARGVQLGDEGTKVARAVADAEAAEAIGPTSGRVDLEELARFAVRAQTFRCRVEVDGTFKGSGCLLGPGLVLTAWHVVRVQGPNIEQHPEPKVSVVLADGSTHETRVPLTYASECGDSEWRSRAPRADSEVEDRHDVALLSLLTPAARHLGYATLPATAPAVGSKSPVFLLDFPKGANLGLGPGRASKIRNLTERLRHDVETDSGSSGGACFDGRFELLGLHQGRIGNYGRLVPLSLFRDELVGFVSADVAPTAVWHLDGESSQLVIARDLFVRSVAAAGRDTTRVRGIRVRRRRPAAGDETGLGFSYRILSELLMRRGGEHLLVTIPLDEQVPDLVSDIAQRVRAAGIPVVAPAEAGDAARPAAPEAAALEEASRLASAVNEAAASASRTVWFFIDNPSVPLTEPARLHVEGFVAACLAQPRLRLVVAGLETMPLAGLEFSSPAAAEADGPAGMVVDYVGGFTRDDLLDCLTLAANDLVGRADPAVIGSWVDVALLDIADFNGEYADADLGTVVTRLQPYLQLLRKQGGGAP